MCCSLLAFPPQSFLVRCAWYLQRQPETRWPTRGRNEGVGGVGSRTRAVPPRCSFPAPHNSSSQGKRRWRCRRKWPEPECWVILLAVSFLEWWLPYLAARAACSSLELGLCTVVGVFLFFGFCLFICLWLRWVFVVAVRGLSLVAASGGYSLLQHAGLVALRHVGSSWTRAQTRVPCIGRRILNHCATGEVPRTLHC